MADDSGSSEATDPDEPAGEDGTTPGAGGAGGSGFEEPTTEDLTGGPPAEEASSDGDNEGLADGAGAEEPAAPGGPADDGGAGNDGVAAGDGDAADEIPADVRKYARFKKVDGAEYDRVNDFLRDRTYVTAREWAIARLCADFRTETGVEMTKIGENLPHLVPFMTDTYSPQAVNQARASFEEKVHKAGATFLYGAMCDFFTAEELDELMYEVTEVAKFLLEVEGVDLSVEEELEAEDRISSVMREVRSASEALRYEECPECGHELRE
jgi:hypothetical protein